MSILPGDFHHRQGHCSKHRVGSVSIMHDGHPGWLLLTGFGWLRR